MTVHTPTFEQDQRADDLAWTYDSVEVRPLVADGADMTVVCYNDGQPAYTARYDAEGDLVSENTYRVGHAAQELA